MSVKIYDFLGNLVQKINVELDETELEAISIKDLIKEVSMQEELKNGFKYYAFKSHIWVQVKPDTLLGNVFVLKEDFENTRAGQLLRVVLAKSLTLRLNTDDSIKFSLNRKALIIKDLLTKLVEFENFKKEMKGKSSEEKSILTKKIIGMSMQSVLYYKSIIRKAKQFNFDFSANSKEPIKILIAFVKRNRKLH